LPARLRVAGSVRGTSDSRRSASGRSIPVLPTDGAAAFGVGTASAALDEARAWPGAIGRPGYSPRMPRDDLAAGPAPRPRPRWRPGQGPSRTPSPGPVSCSALLPGTPRVYSVLLCLALGLLFSL